MRSGTTVIRISGIAAITASLVMAATLAGCAPPDLAAAPPLTIGGPHDVYRMGVGDKIKLGVFNEPNLSGDFEIGAAGTVAVPLIGTVRAEGRSLEDFRREVTTRLSSGYLNNPKVSVEMLNYRPVFVHGEVKKGGEYKYRTGIRLRDAVAMAGGYTYRAEQSYVELSRNGGPQSTVSAGSNFVLLPGDNIHIPERFF